MSITWDQGQTASGAAIEMYPADASCTRWMVEVGGTVVAYGEDQAEARGVFYFLCALPASAVTALVTVVEAGEPVVIP